MLAFNCYYSIVKDFIRVWDPAERFNLLVINEGAVQFGLKDVDVSIVRRH